MSKIAVIADTHFHCWPQFATGVGAENTRFKQQLAFFDHVCTQCSLEGIRTLVHLGDLFHVRDLQRYQIYNAVYSAVRKWSEQLDIILLTGNHDWVNRNGSILTTEAFDGILTLVREPRFDSKLDALLLPYTTNFEHMERVLTEGANKNVAVFGHLDITGAVAGSAGFVLDIGLNPSTLQGYPLGLFGHYHFHQQIKLGEQPLPCYYLGTLVPIDFNEEGQKGHWAVYDPEKKSIEFRTLETPVFRKYKAGIDSVANVGNSYIRVQNAYDATLEAQLLAAGALAIDWEFETKTEANDRIGLSTLSGLSDWNQVVDRYVRHSTTSDADNLVRVGQSLLQRVSTNGAS